MINDKNFGVNINCSFVVSEDGEYTIGVNYTDSKNRSAHSHVTTDNLEDAMNACLFEVLEEIVGQEDFINKKEIEELENKISDSEEEIKQLEQKIQKLKNENKIREEKINKINTETFFLY